jgi:GNAT superfamily N-acetyltransferase
MTASEDPSTLSLDLSVHARPATREDVTKLEWFGQYTHYRNLIRRAYQEQRHGTRMILVADLDGFPIGQVFIQYIAHNPRIADGVTRAYFYAFRVFELFRGRGVGTYLLQQAEQHIQERGYTHAIRLYKRMGYHIMAEDSGHWHYVDHRGMTHHVHEPSWVMQRKL